MLPLCGHIYFLSAAVILLALTRLYASARKNKTENVSCLLKSFALIFAFFFLSGLPGIVLMNPIQAQALFLLSWIPVYFSLYYLTKIALNILSLERLRKPFSITIGIILAVSIIFGIVFFALADTVIYQDVFYCYRSSPVWLLTTNGLILSFFLIANALFFFTGGLKSSEKRVRLRGLLISVGMFLIGIASLINCVLLPNLNGMKWLFITAELSLLSGAGFLYAGIYHQKNV